MSAPRNASAEIGQRRKYSFHGIDYPSVTTILKLGRPKEWMGAWAAKEVATLAVSDVANRADLLMYWMAADAEAHTATKTHQKWHAKRCPYQPSAIGYLKTAPWRKRDAAANAGTLRHEVLEAMAREQALPDEAPARAQLEAWRTAYRPFILESECQVVNPDAGYAGSLDLIAEVYGRRLLIDLKTSKRFDGAGRPKNVDRDWCLQLAAYRYATFIFEDDRQWSLPEVEGAAVLWLPSDAPDEWMFLELPAGGAEFAAFMAAKATHDDYRSFEKQALGEIILPQALEVA